jgi:cytochrome P450 family 4
MFKPSHMYAYVSMCTYVYLISYCNLAEALVLERIVFLWFKNCYVWKVFLCHRRHIFRICACLYVYMCIYLYIYTYIYMYVYIHIFYIYKYIYIHVYIYVFMYVHIYIYIYLHIYKYIHIYT